jgi:hypothetical protein
MKTTLFCAILLSTGLARAFDGAPTFTTKTGHVEHTLALSHWQVDARGVPSFDYVYQQRAGACRFQLAGHLIAITGERDGKAELEVYNPQNDDGSEAPPVTMFYDDSVSMTLPYKGKVHEVGLSGTLTTAQLAQVCTKRHDKKLSVDFHK